MKPFDLREAGPDGAFDTADDVIHPLAVTPTYTAGTTIGLLIQDGPLTNGHYRFTANSSLKDLDGNPLDGDGDGIGGDAYVQLFDVTSPPGCVFESSGNDAPATATPLALTENPPASGLWLSQHGLGSLLTTSDVDYWSFTASAGDVVSVSVDRYQDSGVTTSLTLLDSNGNGCDSSYSDGPNGGSFISHYAIQTDGTYYVRVGSANNGTGTYETHVDLTRGIQQESDRGYSNDSVLGANAITLTPNGSGHIGATVAGTVMASTGSNTDKDLFLLGTLNAGNVVDLSVSLPTTSTLAPNVTLVDANGAALADENAPPVDGQFLATISTDGVYYAKIESGDGGTPGPWAQYLLNVDVTDLTLPKVTSVSPLPDDNGTTTAVIDRLAVTVSKDLDPATVASGSFDLRAAGPDGQFDTADDVVFSLAADSTYTSGTSVGLVVQDGPLPNGQLPFYRQGHDCGSRGQSAGRQRPWDGRSRLCSACSTSGCRRTSCWKGPTTTRKIRRRRWR